MGVFDKLADAAVTVSTGGLNKVADSGVVNKFVGGITGQTAADAAIEAANIQAQAATAQADAMRDATQMTVDEMRLARETAREDLAPFVDFGAGFMGGAQDAIAATNRLFDDPTSIMENPMFTALQDDVRRQNLQNAAVRGRLGTGGTLQALESSALRTGYDILNTERAASMNRANMMANLVGMGQSAAAGSGAASMTAGQNIGSNVMSGNQAISNLMTGAANAQAAGTVGAANAQTQGIFNILNLGARFAGA